MVQDNYIGKVNRIYVEDKIFKDSEGREVSYSRLCLRITVKGSPKVLEFAPKSSKIDDVITFLDLADEVDQGSVLNN